MAAHPIGLNQCLEDFGRGWPGLKWRPGKVTRDVTRRLDPRRHLCGCGTRGLDARRSLSVKLEEGDKILEIPVGDELCWSGGPSDRDAEMGKALWHSR